MATLYERKQFHCPWNVVAGSLIVLLPSNASQERGAIETMNEALDEGARFYPEPILVREAGAETLELTTHFLMLAG